MTPTLSIIIPVLDEEATLARVVESVFQELAERFRIEIVVVDDGSTDKTPSIIEDLEARHAELHSARHPTPRGKGAAVRTGIGRCTGDIVLIQDADLEYLPRDIPRLVQPILEDHADVVYGSRFTGAERAVNFFWHTVANQMLTLAANALYNANFSDVYTGYKAIRASLLRGMHLEARSFTIELELTAKLRRSGARFYEVPITYHARTYAEGKKIHLRDAARAFAAVIYHRFSRLH